MIKNKKAFHMDCELCGASGKIVRAKIEDTVLNVCTSCSQLGLRLKTEKVIVKNRAHIKIDDIPIDPNFAKKIKRARESRGMTRKDIAEKLSESESIIIRIEKGMRPTNSVAQKLERFLEIKILGYENMVENMKNKKTEILTLGDIADVKIKRKSQQI